VPPGGPARTGEEVALSSGKKVPNMIALDYTGADAEKSKWPQFVWFELVATPRVRSIMESVNASLRESIAAALARPAIPVRSSYFAAKNAWVPVRARRGRIR
jgi:hypothetical protein